MNKIMSKKTASLLQNGKKYLVGYILGGYPNSESFFEVLETCNASEFDILEIGFASENPYSDGQVIADAHRKVDKSVCCSIDYWKKIRRNTEKPIWVMGYRDDLLKNDLYLELSELDLVDGIVISDMTNEERVQLQKMLNHTNTDIIGFSNPEMSDKELEYVLSNFPLVYEQLYVGQTGTCPAGDEYHEMLSKSLENKGIYGFAGFGISTAERINLLFNEGFHGAIVGTGILKHINVSIESLKSYLENLGETKAIWQ